jgi:peptidoglycan/LPS O-acetylase OafA/YrhL
MTNLSSASTSGEILRPKMPELDVIRGLAILGVFLYHAFWNLPNAPTWAKPVRLLLTATWAGHFGVNLFFVLSGFLITGILIDGRNQEAYYARFYKRRALRILPVYLAVIGVMAIIKAMPLSFFLLSLVYVSNLTPMLGIPVAYPVLWSLAVEEQFYLLWPMVCRKLTNKKLLLLCLAIVVLSPLSRFISLHAATLPTGREFAFNGYTWNAVDGLACGALVSLALREYKPTRAEFARYCYALLSVAIVLWFCLVPFGILSRRTDIGVAFQVSLVNVAFTGLLGIFLYIGSGPRAPWVQMKPLLFLGYISYGWYLIHYAALKTYDQIMIHWGVQVPGEGPKHIGDALTKMIVVGLVSIGAAYLSRKYFEERFLRLKGE